MRETAMATANGCFASVRAGSGTKSDRVILFDRLDARSDAVVNRQTCTRHSKASLRSSYF